MPLPNVDLNALGARALVKFYLVMIVLVKITNIIRNLNEIRMSQPYLKGNLLALRVIKTKHILLLFLFKEIIILLLDFFLSTEILLTTQKTNFCGFNEKWKILLFKQTKLTLFSNGYLFIENK